MQQPTVLPYRLFVRVLQLLPIKVFRHMRSCNWSCKIVSAWTGQILWPSSPSYLRATALSASFWTHLLQQPCCNEKLRLILQNCEWLNWTENLWPSLLTYLRATALSASFWTHPLHPAKPWVIKPEDSVIITADLSLGDFSECFGLDPPIPTTYSPIISLIHLNIATAAHQSLQPHAKLDSILQNHEWPKKTESMIITIELSRGNSSGCFCNSLQQPTVLSHHWFVRALQQLPNKVFSRIWSCARFLQNCEWSDWTDFVTIIADQSLRDSSECFILDMHSYKVTAIECATQLNVQRLVLFEEPSPLWLRQRFRMWPK